ncbi:MAG: TIGR03087 family PEP-CTERM/XrtA system glycosyltransferase [Kiritimatiellae bacterium]|jgi:sugar transferase (PEP-CTERM/EpsH1 system associated)|nr:TIGR03087 family PEP-CTERM/XrtA system glycosyltransferase [Kiritimatiellia bacterium]
MNILYLAHRIPYPPNKGDKIRSFNEVKYLSQQHNIDLVCLADDPADLQYKVNLEEYCQHVDVIPLNKTIAKIKGLLSLAGGGSISVGYFYQKKMQQAIDQHLKKTSYDAILCFSSTMAEYVFKSSVKDISARLIMDFCDVDSDKWLQYAAEARFPMTQLYRLEQRRLAAYECKIQREFDRTILISAAEAHLFRQFSPDHLDKLSIIPNGVDHEFFTPNYAPPASSLQPTALSLVFTGAMDYHANIDGVIWFCEYIWPELKLRFPDLTFYIVGSHPDPAVRDLAKNDGVIVTGFVEDIREYYALADICVVPLRMARGVQNKVLEAMSMGKAVVATAKANAGIQAEDGKQLLIADDVDIFIDKITALLNDQNKRVALSSAAREFVIEKYDWNRNLQLLEVLLQ